MAKVLELRLLPVTELEAAYVVLGGRLALVVVVEGVPRVVRFLSR